MSEHSEQCALFLMLRSNPKYEWVYAIPNGGHRNKAVAVKMKLEGVKAGVWDIFVPIPAGGYHGLYIEMKFGNNKLTEKQKAFEQFVTGQGYKTSVCYNAEEAKQVIEEYVNVGGL